MASDKKNLETQDTHILKEHEEEEIEVLSANTAPLTQRQRIVQVVLGWLSGFLIWMCMVIGLLNPENELLNWLFLIVFAAAMLGKNAFEKRTGIGTRVYIRHFLISLIVFLIIFIILGPVTHVLDTTV